MPEFSRPSRPPLRNVAGGKSEIASVRRYSGEYRGSSRIAGSPSSSASAARPSCIEDARLAEVIVGKARGKRHSEVDLGEGLHVAPLLREDLGRHSVSQRIGLPRRVDESLSACGQRRAGIRPRWLTPRRIGRSARTPPPRRRCHHAVAADEADRLARTARSPYSFHPRSPGDSVPSPAAPHRQLRGFVSPQIRASSVRCSCVSFTASAATIFRIALSCSAKTCRIDPS